MMHNLLGTLFDGKESLCYNSRLDVGRLLVYSRNSFGVIALMGFFNSHECLPIQSQNNLTCQ